MSAGIELHEHEEAEDLPAWSLPAEAVDRIRVPVTLPDQVTREWAWGGSTGAGVRVCILDSGIELDHPLVGRVDHSVAVLRDEEGDGLTFYSNPPPPVEFFGRGLDLDVAWLDGGTLRCTGNSFATPHIAGICALILGKHPYLTPFQLKSVLYQTASNAKEAT